MHIDFFSQFDFKKLLQRDYLLEINPEAKGLYFYPGIIFGIMLILAMVIALKSKKVEENYRKLYAKFFHLFFWTGLIGLILIFFRSQGIPYLGARIFLLSLMAFDIFFLIFIGYYKFFILKEEIKNYQKRKNFEKYLP